MKNAVTKVAARLAAKLNKVWAIMTELPLIGRPLAWLGNTSKEVSIAFFLLEEAQTTEEVTVRVATTLAKRTFYFLADWWLALLSWSMIGGLKLLGVGFGHAVLVMWAYDVIVAFVFLYIYKRHNVDLALGINFRRAVDAVFQRSRIAGIIALIGVILKAAYWDGPEHVVIFFERELKTTARMSAVLIVLTALQAFIWTAIIYLGLESLGDLVRFLWNHLA